MKKKEFSATVKALERKSGQRFELKDLLRYLILSKINIRTLVYN